MSQTQSETPTPVSVESERQHDNLQIGSIEISNFKKIHRASITLNDITYLVGGNNSGKSSVLQAIHTAFSCARLSLERGTFEESPSGKLKVEPSKVLPEVDLLYRPTSKFIDLGHNQPYRSKSKYSGQVTFVGANSTANQAERLTVSMYKAHNHNNAGVDLGDDTHNLFKRAISDESTLFSVYVPGLTGIPLHEEYKTLGIIRRTAAGGEANLVFRNILYHLGASGLERLEGLLEQIYGTSAKFDIKFDPNKDQHIDVRLSLGEEDLIPVDLWGTGVLQVTQILAYALLFRPELFLIDEPDSHLHPALQRTLASTFQAITATLGCRIIVTTHSRHMLSAAPNGTRIVWMKNGQVENPDARKEVAELLLDLGALDTFDSAAKFVVYTEDAKDSMLMTCLKSLQERKLIPPVAVLSFNGVTNMTTLTTLDSGVQAVTHGKRLIVHRDRDCMTDGEVDQWKKDLQDARIKAVKNLIKAPTPALTPMTPFVPAMTDTESYCCTPEHISLCTGMSTAEAESLTARVISANITALREKFDTKRASALSQFWPKGGSPLSDELWDEWESDPHWRRIYGKELLNRIGNDKAMHSKKKTLTSTPSKALCQELIDFFSAHFPESMP